MSRATTLGVPMPLDDRSNGTCATTRAHVSARRALRSVGAAVAVVVLALAIIPPTIAIAQDAPAPTLAQIERGVEVYKANYCGACHALEVVGSAGIFGPSHDAMATTALERLADPAYSGAATTAEQYTHESILDPNVYLVPGYAMTPHAMPSYAHLATEDVDALVAMLLAQ